MAGINPIGDLLGGINQTLGTIAQGISIVNSATNDVRNIGGDNRRSQTAQLKAQQDAALAQLQQRQALEQQQARQEATLQRQEIDTATDQAEATRQAALKRAVSRRRADFASRGISANEGSAEAVLLGLFEESEEDRAERDRIDSLRTQAIDLDLSTQQSRNLLEASQLAEKQRLTRILNG